MNTPSDTTKRPGGHTGDPRKPGLDWRQTIGLFAALLILNLILSALFYAAAAKPRVTIPYRPTFIAQVQAGNVVTITATDTVIQGAFKPPAAPDTPAATASIPAPKVRTALRSMRVVSANDSRRASAMAAA